MNKKKHRLRNLIPIIGLILGLCVLGAYPALDLYYAYQHATQGKRIQQAVSALSAEQYTEYQKQAEEYNTGLATGDTPKGTWNYESQLAVSGPTAPFAELKIPKISLDMPIYHGTSEDTLMNGVGHLKGSSLPIGGKSTHAVLTAHSGMTGMRAFDDIRQLKKGDTFRIEVLGKTIAYEVYSTEVLWPDEADRRISIEDGKDLCTLITCTPYGVNDHRLLVHGRRVPYKEEKKQPLQGAEELVTNRRYAPFFLGLLVVLLLIIAAAVKKAKRRNKRRS